MNLKILIFFSLISSSLVYAEQLTIDKVMTPEELIKTGVSKLSPEQRRALDSWLNSFTNHVYKVASQKSGGTKNYVGVGSGHWIQKNSMGGEMITLEDGSLWEINSIDRIYTGIWLPISEITVVEASQPIGEYKYILINTDDGEKALARYMGQ